VKLLRVAILIVMSVGAKENVKQAPLLAAGMVLPAVLLSQESVMKIVQNVIPPNFAEIAKQIAIGMTAAFGLNAYHSLNVTKIVLNAGLKMRVKTALLVANGIGSMRNVSQSLGVIPTVQSAVPKARAAIVLLIVIGTEANVNQCLLNVTPIVLSVLTRGPVVLVKLIANGIYGSLNV